MMRIHVSICGDPAGCRRCLGGYDKALAQALGREVRAEAGFIERLVGINDPKDTTDSISRNSEVAGRRVVKAIKAGETL